MSSKANQGFGIKRVRYEGVTWPISHPNFPNPTHRQAPAFHVEIDKPLVSLEFVKAPCLARKKRA